MGFPEDAALGIELTDGPYSATQHVRCCICKHEHYSESITITSHIRKCDVCEKPTEHLNVWPIEKQIPNPKTKE